MAAATKKSSGHSIRISELAYAELSKYCKENNYVLGAYASAAIRAVVKKNKSHINVYDHSNE